MIGRPSGTEPKLKVCFEVVVAAGEDERAQAEIAALRRAVGALLETPS